MWSSIGYNTRAQLHTKQTEDGDMQQGERDEAPVEPEGEQ